VHHRKPRRGGLPHRAGATVKDKAGDAADKIGGAVDTAKDKLSSND